MALGVPVVTQHEDYVEVPGLKVIRVELQSWVYGAETRAITTEREVPSWVNVGSWSWAGAQGPSSAGHTGVWSAKYCQVTTDP